MSEKVGGHGNQEVLVESQILQTLIEPMKCRFFVFANLYFFWTKDIDKFADHLLLNQRLVNREVNKKLIFYVLTFRSIFKQTQSV